MICDELCRLEMGAAEKIACLVRGWLMRRWLKRNVKKLRARRRMKRSYKVIQRQVQMKLELEEKQKMVRFFLINFNAPANLSGARLGEGALLTNFRGLLSLIILSTENCISPYFYAALNE